MRFSRILCIVRGTDSDRHAVEAAVDMLTPRRRRLNLVYVITVPRTVAIDAHLPEEIQRAEDALANAEEMTGINPEDVSTVILQGRSLGPIILREVFDRRISAIVTAIEPVHRLGGYDIGPDTLYLLEKSPSSVIVVRRPADEWIDDTEASAALASGARLG